MIRTREKRTSKIERRSLDEVDDPRGVLLRVGVAKLVHEVLTLLLDLHPLEAVIVQPALEAVDVALGVRLAALSALDRKVGVDPVRSLTRLVDDHDAYGDHADDQHSREAQEHDGDGEAPGDSHPPERPHERVEEQRDQRRHDEEEDDVSDRARQRPEEQQDERQPHELHPARNLDLVRRRRHPDDRTQFARRSEAGSAGEPPGPSRSSSRE